jgi:hypothetical protein
MEGLNTKKAVFKEYRMTVTDEGGVMAGGMCLWSVIFGILKLSKK